MKNTSKTIIIFVLFLSASTLIFAQNETEKNILPYKFSLEAGFGSNSLISRQNLSPWGAEYRINYDDAITAYVRTNFLFADRTSLGLMANSMVAFGTYALNTGESIVEDITTYYIAPQFGIYSHVSQRMVTNLNMGFGYLYYQSKGLMSGTTEYSINSHLPAVNADISLEYFVKKRSAIGGSLSAFTAFDAKKQHRKIGDASKETISVSKWDAIRVLNVGLNFYVKVYF